jgi:uncharacterized small protein (TIGR04563 family)
MTSKQQSKRRSKVVYLLDDVLSEMEAEAKRLGRHFSWLVQLAWKLSRADIRKIPGAYKRKRRSR